MGVVADKLKELREREAKIKEMGGAKAVAAQLERGKMTARDRINYFFDPGTFFISTASKWQRSTQVWQPLHLDSSITALKRGSVHGLWFTCEKLAFEAS